MGHIIVVAMTFFVRIMAVDFSDMIFITMLGTVPLVIVFSAWVGAAGVLIGQAVGVDLFALIAFIAARRLMRGAPLGGALPDRIDKGTFGWLHRN